MVLTSSTSDQVFTLTRQGLDALRYEANTRTTTDSGVFISESVGTLRRAR